MANITQVTTANTFSQWLTATQELVSKMNTLTDGGTTSTFYANTNLQLTGNLVVQGDITYTNTEIYLVADNIITLNAAIDQAGSPISDAGIEVDRGSSANVKILWNETSDKWTLTNDGTNYIEIGSADASSYANSAYAVANIASATATAAFIHANSAYESQNTTGVYANSAFLQANTPSYTANSGAIYANGAFTAANNAAADALAFAIALG